ncbi:MAG TPA: universal stress protein [bacterium]|nr:universal stress protein [bacterium]
MKLVVATDGSPHAILAAAYAVRLAREIRKAEITIVNVGHIPTVALGGPGTGAMVNFGELEQALEQAGQAILEQTKRQFESGNAPVAAVYRTGDPAAEIIKVAQETKADLIIIGSRGLGQIGGLILGSVSERVLHAAPVPVLVVR